MTSNVIEMHLKYWIILNHVLYLNIKSYLNVTAAMINKNSTDVKL